MEILFSPVVDEDSNTTNPGSTTDIPCRCNQSKIFNQKRKINDFMYILAIFFIVISCTHTLCLANFSRRRPSPWNVMDSHDLDSPPSDYNDDNVKKCQGEYLDGYSLSGGTKAGRYENIGNNITDITDCSNLCCQKDDCSLAIMLLYPKSSSKSCFNVHCYDAYDTKGCKPVISVKSRYHPFIFKKIEIPIDVKTPSLNSNSATINLSNPITSASRDNLDNNVDYEKSKDDGICQKYSGSVCANIIDSTKYYHYSTHNGSILDARLRKPIDLLRARFLTDKCSKLAIQAICYRFYPQCLDPLNPKPISICDDYCDKLINGDCAVEFEKANVVTYLQKVIPGCDKPHTNTLTTGCIHLSDETSDGSSDESSSQEEIEKTINERSSVGELEINDTPMNTSITHTVSAQTSSSTTTTTIPPNVTTVVPTPSTSKSAITKILTTTTKVPSTPKQVTTVKGVISSVPPFVTNNVSKPTFVDVKTADAKETSLKVASVSASTAPPTVPVHVDEEIRVSAGDNTDITLPTNYVSLFASTWPKDEGDYTYKWTQISSPAKSHGYIEGATTKNVKLTNLDVIGTYTFKLEVLSTLKKGKHGVGFVNITVKSPTRINHPPRAEITQKETVIQLPTNTVILDGSKSTDDVKIVSYKWEELKGPMKEKSFVTSSKDSQILQLKNLVAGVYKFRLTVTDSNGETDNTEASLTVKKEPDYPPKANAGNDVVIHLPNNSVVLNGNKSTDDKGSLKYQWSKSSDSPPCDMTGSDKSQLMASRLKEGSYQFKLTVTDASGQTDATSVKVVVLPEKNTAPVAIAGDDKEIIYPDDSTTLDGSKSNDNSKIVSFKWEQVSGPKKAKLTSATEKKVHLSDLVVGTYVMKLTVVDDKNLVGTDSIKVYVKKDHNEHPVAIAGRPVTIFLPGRSVTLDGSKSHDDELIDQYLWTRAGLSPAAGVVVNHSDHQAILHLTDLVKGRYIFDLTVTDNKGLIGTDSVTIEVLENPSSLGLVELHIFLDIDNFSEENKKQLIRKISVILEVGKEFVIVEEIAGATYGKGVMILFYVKDSTTERILDGKYVADLLKHKVGFGGKLFEYTMQRVEPYICRNNCSEHGYCDKSTKQCVCDSFWTANFIKARFGEKESNCDWSILYLSVAVFGLFLMLIGVAWAVCFCFARKKRNKRRARYRALRTTDPETKEEILLIPKGMKAKFSANSLTFTESDEDSEQETTVFDKKKLVNGHVRMNGTANGSVAKYLEKNF